MSPALDQPAMPEPSRSNRSSAPAASAGGGLDLTRCEALATAAGAGDSTAFRTLAELLWPWLMAFARSNKSLPSSGRDEEAVHTVAALVIEKLGDQRCRSLSHYTRWRGTNREKTLLDWLRIVIKNVIRDYARAAGAHKRKTEAPSARRALNELTQLLDVERTSVRPPFTAAQTAREVLALAREHLKPSELRALGLWLDGATAGEIGRDLGISKASAHRLYARALERLRRKLGHTEKQKERS